MCVCVCIGLYCTPICQFSSTTYLIPTLIGLFIRNLHMHYLGAIPHLLQSMENDYHGTTTDQILWGSVFAQILKGIFTPEGLDQSVHVHVCYIVFCTFSLVSHCSLLTLLHPVIIIYVGGISLFFILISRMLSVLPESGSLQVQDCPAAE